MSTRIKKCADFIRDRLLIRDIVIETDDIIKDLETVRYVKFDNLDDEKIYESYLESKANESEIFKRIKNGEDVIYDMKFCLNNALSSLSCDEFGIDSHFNYKNQLYVKFNEDFFDDNFDIKKVKKIARYFNAYRTDEIYFNVGYKDRNIIFMVNILKKIGLPLKIVYYENCDSTIFLYMEDKKWPTDVDAIECVKSALLRYIYLHCNISYGITREAVFLKLKDQIYKVMIVYERNAADFGANGTDDKANLITDTKCNNHIVNTCMSTLHIYKNFKTGKKIAKEYIKIYLSAHGYFPFYIKNYEIDKLLADINAVNPGQVFTKFIKLPKQKFKEFQSLDSILLDRLVQLNHRVLNHLHKSIFIDGQKLLKPNFSDYDFVLMNENTEGQSNKIIFIPDNDMSEFLLGQVEVNDFFGLETYAYLLYSEYNQILMVKMKDMKFISLVINILLIKTSFSYIYKKF